MDSFEAHRAIFIEIDRKCGHVWTLIMQQIDSRHFGLSLRFDLGRNCNKMRQLHSQLIDVRPLAALNELTKVLSFIDLESDRSATN